MKYLLQFFAQGARKKNAFLADASAEGGGSTCLPLKNASFFWLKVKKSLECSETKEYFVEFLHFKVFFLQNHIFFLEFIHFRLFFFKKHIFTCQKNCIKLLCPLSPRVGSRPQRTLPPTMHVLRAPLGAPDSEKHFFLVGGAREQMPPPRDYFAPKFSK